MATTNNTSVDFLTEYEMQNLKHANLCKVKQIILQLYSKLSSIINSINTLIGLDDETLDVIDNISETIAETRELKNWYNNLKGLTLSHINHGGTAKGDNNPTFKAYEDRVEFNYDCFTMDKGSLTSHDKTPIPVASATLAGVLKASDYKKIDDFFNGTSDTDDKVNTYQEIVDFLDGVEENSSEADIAYDATVSDDKIIFPDASEGDVFHVIYPGPSSFYNLNSDDDNVTIDDSVVFTVNFPEDSVESYTNRELKLKNINGTYYIEDKAKNRYLYNGGWKKIVVTKTTTKPTSLQTRLSNLETKANNLTTYTHIHHKDDDTDYKNKSTFTATKNSVTLNFLCTDPNNGKVYQKNPALPVANATQAGIISAESYNKINKIDDIAKKVDVVITPYITTITINQKGEISDPDSMITGDIANGKDPKENAVAWIRANSHKYVSQGYDEDTLILRQLDDSDTTKYADGADASSDITKQDVFMKLPEFWYKGEELEEDLWKISFTYKEELVDDTWLHWEGDTCIGVYEGCVDNNSLHSYSGSIPIVNKNFNEFKDLAKNNNSQLITYEAHKIMSLLFYAYYGTTNSQGVCGSGATTYPKTTGLTNSLGMNDTINENKSSILYWGLENWWGDISEFVDDLVTENTTGLVNLLDVNGNVVRTMQAGVVGTTMQPIAAKYIFGDNLDLIVKAHDSSELKYYTCVGCVAPAAGYVAARSDSGAYSNDGVAFLYVGSSASSSFDYLGSRLCHKGKYLIQ